MGGILTVQGRSDTRLRYRFANLEQAERQPRFAGDEQGPAVTDDVESVGHRAVLVVVLRHAFDDSGRACCCEG